MVLLSTLDHRRYSFSVGEEPSAEAAAERSEGVTVASPVGAAAGNAGVDDDASKGRGNALPPPLALVLELAPCGREANAVMVLLGGLVLRTGSRSLLSPRCRLALPESVPYGDDLWQDAPKGEGEVAGDMERLGLITSCTFLPFDR